MTDATNDSKSDLRSRMRTALAAMTDAQRHEASALACSRLLHLDAFRHAATVMLYMPLAGEVDLTPAAIRCFQLGKTVCVPKVDWRRQDMIAVEVTAFDDHVMDLDEHGIRVPRSTRPIPPEMINLVIVPGLAFDSRGHRLGRGGGYYDRFLQRLKRSAIAAGLAFDQQIVDSVPAGPGDVAVDVIVTDRRLSYTHASRSRR